MPRWIQAVLYFAFALMAAVACYLRPIPGDYDRYQYEAVARTLTADWPSVQSVLTSEHPQLRLSPGFDTPEHMAELEPIFGIRPLYVEVIEILHRAGVSYQAAISAISAACYFLIAGILFAWTRRPLLSALAIATPAFLQLGRQGVPDGLNALCVLAALYLLIMHRRMAFGLSLLLVAVWIRTDSLLVVCGVLAFLCYQKKLAVKYGAALAALAFASVEAVNHFSGNYGYAVLFRLTFLGGAHPLLASTAHITMRDYLRGFASGAPSLLPQLAPWLLFAIAAWHFQSKLREWLVPIWGAALAHVVLFPSPESRYLNWAMLFSAVAFIAAFPAKEKLRVLIRVPRADVGDHVGASAG